MTSRLNLHQYNKGALIELLTLLLGLGGPLFRHQDIKQILELAHWREERRLILAQSQKLRKRLRALREHPDRREVVRLQRQYSRLCKREAKMNGCIQMVMKKLEEMVDHCDFCGECEVVGGRTSRSGGGHGQTTRRKFPRA